MTSHSDDLKGLARALESYRNSYEMFLESHAADREQGKAAFIAAFKMSLQMNVRDALPQFDEGVGEATRQVSRPIVSDDPRVLGWHQGWNMGDIVTAIRGRGWKILVEENLPAEGMIANVAFSTIRHISIEVPDDIRTFHAYIIEVQISENILAQEIVFTKSVLHPRTVLVIREELMQKEANAAVGQKALLDETASKLPLFYARLLHDESAQALALEIVQEGFTESICEKLLDWGAFSLPSASRMGASFATWVRENRPDLLEKCHPSLL